MEVDEIEKKLINVIESYFKLNHLPFTVKLDAILHSMYDYQFQELDVVAFKYLNSIVDNTDNYISLCKVNGKYLFSISVDDETIRLMANVKFK